MQLSKEMCARKRIHDGCSMLIENSVIRHKCSESLGNPRDAEQLSMSRIFQSALTTIKDFYSLINDLHTPQISMYL